jgi:hypothetical protein
VFAAACAHLGQMADARAGLDAFMHLMPGLSAEDKRLTRLRRRLIVSALSTACAKPGCRRNRYRGTHSHALNLPECLLRFMSP